MSNTIESVVQLRRICDSAWSYDEMKCGPIITLTIPALLELKAHFSRVAALEDSVAYTREILGTGNMP